MVEFVDSTRSDVLVACHRRTLGAIGGVPAEILYESMKTVVTTRDAYGRGRHRFHDRLWALAKKCGYRPRLCWPYRPQTKGKVERSVDYVDSSFFDPFATDRQTWTGVGETEIIRPCTVPSRTGRGSNRRLQGSSLR